MDDLKHMFGNKYVLIGGVAIGALILFMSHNASAAGSGDASGSSTGAVSPAYTSAVMAYNTAATQEVTKQAAIAAQVAIARSSNDTQLHVTTLNTIANMDANQAGVMKQQMISQQGVLQAQLQAYTAVSVDYSNNTARMYEAQQQTNQTSLTSNAQVAVAQAQAKAAKNAAKWGAISSIAGTVGKAVTAIAA